MTLGMHTPEACGLPHGWRHRWRSVGRAVRKIETLIIKFKDYGKLFSSLFQKNSHTSLSAMAGFSSSGSPIRGQDDEKNFF